MSSGSEGGQASAGADIREQVEANRGIAKKLELLVPGLRTYRTTEDLRIADDLLRHQVADRIDQAKGNLEALRRQIAAAGDYAALLAVGSLISELQELSGKVRYAAQGYAPLVAAIRIDEGKLNALYSYDYEFVSSAMGLVDATSGLKFDQSSAAQLRSALDSLRSAVEEFRGKWLARMEAVEGILAAGQAGRR